MRYFRRKLIQELERNRRRIRRFTLIIFIRKIDLKKYSYTI